jgi:hypothetical protein
VTAQHRRRRLGDRIGTVRLEAVVLGRRATLEPVLGARAGVDERLDVGASRRVQQVGGADDVRTEDRRTIRLPGIRAVRGEVEDPLGARTGDGLRDRIPVIVDSGVRSGADIFRALALGAAAVGLGRPYVWGLAAGGEDGVREVIRNYRADFDLTLGLAGVASACDIGRENVTRV